MLVLTSIIRVHIVGTTQCICRIGIFIFIEINQYCLETNKKNKGVTAFYKENIHFTVHFLFFKEFFAPKLYATHGTMLCVAYRQKDT